MSNGINHSKLELQYRKLHSFKLCISIMQDGEEIIIIALTMHSGLTDHIAVPESLFPRCSSQGPYKQCISHKCYCLGQMFIVKIKATMCLRKMVPLGHRINVCLTSIFIAY